MRRCVPTERILNEVPTAEPSSADASFGALALAAAAALALSACGGGDAGTPGGEASGGGGGDEEVAVTLITKTSTNPFFIAMQKGAEEAGKANNVTITTAAGKEDGDETTQIAAIEAADRPRRQGHLDHAGHRRGQPGDRAGP